MEVPLYKQCVPAATLHTMWISSATYHLFSLLRVWCENNLCLLFTYYCLLFITTKNDNTSFLCKQEENWCTVCTVCTVYYVCIVGTVCTVCTVCTVGTVSTVQLYTCTVHTL